MNPYSPDQIAANRAKLARENPTMYAEILKAEAKRQANGGLSDSVSQGHTGYDNADEFLGANYWSGHESAQSRASGSGTVDPDAALRNTLRAEITARGGDIESVYSSLFGELENLTKTRDAELESEYGEQFKKAADTYSGALPEIETSYAAIGASDSTDQSDAKGKAKSGYEETTRTIGKNKADDKAKLGAYKREQEAKVNADREAARRNVGRAGETTDVGALREMRNNLEGNISQANVTKATLGSDGQARRDITALTGDKGRFDAAVNSLDSIIKSSMSGSVKEAAVKAIADNAGLSDEEKQKVNQMYGNTYAEQAAL